MAFKLTKEQLISIRTAVVFYMQRHISIKNPLYEEYEAILQMLSKSIQDIK